MAYAARLATWGLIVILLICISAFALGPRATKGARLQASSTVAAPAKPSASRPVRAPVPSRGGAPTIHPSAAPGHPVTAIPTPPAASVAAYLLVSGPVLSLGGKTVVLRGENFDNCPALAACAGRSDISRIDVNEADYTTVSNLGGNHVRFGLDYAWWSSNRTQFYAVLDQHISWARAHHLWLIPVMFSPPGGSNGGFGGQGGFWGSRGNQQALTAFWADFASHYANEPTIGGYDIFNEPAPPSALAWSIWAQATADSIRAVDANHFVVLEASSADWNLPLVSGPNLVWSGHCYGAVGTNGCNYPGANPRIPSKRPFFVGEAGSTYPNLAFVPANLASFNQLGVSWTHYDYRHGCGAPDCWGLYQNWVAGDLSSPWTSMIATVSAAMAGSVRP